MLRKSQLYWLAILYGTALASPWFTVSAAESPSAEENQEHLGILPDDDEPVEPKEYSPRDKKLECRKYNNQYISFAANVYHVENCKVRDIQTSDMIFELNRSKVKIIEVDAQTIATLDPGEPITGLKPESKKKRSCKELAGKYVTYSYSDVYYIENCKKNPFPDWETYVDHRHKHGHVKSEIEALTWEEFNSMPVGREIPSILNSEFAKLLAGKSGVDVIPLDEACKGLNGQYASFHSRFYKIEKCRKRAIDPELFSMREGMKKFKVVELKSEQWLSLPDGKPIRQ